MHRIPALILWGTIFVTGSAVFAQDSNPTVGVGGVGTTSAIPAGHGFSASSSSSPGPSNAVVAGRGVMISSGAGGSVNPGTDDGFHAAGTVVSVTAGKGRSTMETVPGRSPTYVYMVQGRRASTSIGGIGP